MNEKEVRGHVLPLSGKETGRRSDVLWRKWTVFSPATRTPRLLFLSVSVEALLVLRDQPSGPHLWHVAPTSCGCCTPVLWPSGLAPCGSDGRGWAAGSEASTELPKGIKDFPIKVLSRENRNKWESRLQMFPLLFDLRLWLCLLIVLNCLCSFSYPAGIFNMSSLAQTRPFKAAVFSREGKRHPT